MTKRSNPEARLQIAVVQHLALAGVPDLMFFKINNEGKRLPQAGLFLKRLGLRPGVADLFIGAPGKPPLFLELKSRGQKPTPAQEAFAAHCHRIGYGYAWADGIDSALTVLRDWGVLAGTSGRRAA